MVNEVIEVESYLVAGGADHLADLRYKARLAIGGEAHHLVLVAVLGEAEELGESGVEQAERVGEPDRAMDVEMVALADAPHEAAEIAEAVDGDEGRFFEGGREESAGEMGAMVLDVVDADLVGPGDAGRGEGIGEFGHFDAVAGAGNEARPIARANGHAGELLPEMRLGVAGNGDMGERGRVDFTEAGPGGEGWEAGPVLDAVKTLLFHRGGEVAVGEEGGGSVAVEGVETEDVHVACQCSKMGLGSFGSTGCAGEQESADRPVARQRAKLFPASRCIKTRILLLFSS